MLNRASVKQERRCFPAKKLFHSMDSKDFVRASSSSALQIVRLSKEDVPQSNFLCDNTNQKSRQINLDEKKE
jgi:hypothetical protein